MKILTLDGGGIRGVCTARILERLDQERRGFMADVDLIAGTSTGGILALALAAEVSFADCVKLYAEHGRRIFASRGIADTLAGDLDEFVRANYAQEGLRSVLVEVFGDKRLGDLKREVLIPAFDILHWRPKLFDRVHDGNETCVDVALATSAAPTYFPIHHGFCDGGLYANNPSDCAVAYARARGLTDMEHSDVRLLSIGTGAVPYEPPGEVLRARQALDLDWGFKQWILDKPHVLLQALFEGTVLASHYRTSQALGDRYHRVQPVLPHQVDLGDPDGVPLLVLTAEVTELEPTLDWLSTHWA